MVTLDGQVITVDSLSLVESEARVSFPTPVSPRHSDSGTKPAIESFHATASGDGQLVAVSRMFAANIALVDLNTRSSTIIDVDPFVSFVGGVSFNNGWIHAGLLAVHAIDRVVVMARDAGGVWSTIGALAIRPPLWGPDTLVNLGHGPQFSIAWTTDGSHLIFATEDGPAEFGVAEVLDGGRRIEYRRSLTACLEESNLPNDIWTANGLITPTATPTSDMLPTPTISATPTATGRPSDTPQPTSTATPRPSATPTTTATPEPRPIYLPVALAERCDPSRQRIDVVLVIDASSSMADLTRAGRPKIDAALDAARAFLDLLALDEANSDPGAPGADGDQAAIVAFNADAWLLAPLIDDRSALDAALDTVTLAQQTRLDRAVAVGAEALADTSRRRAGNVPVLVLLTDGRANPVPVDAAVAEAAAAKAAGVTLFTIGLGEEIDAEALAAMASTPSGFLSAPDAEDLAAAYTQVARSIPCPANAWWGAR